MEKSKQELRDQLMKLLDPPEMAKEIVRKRIRGLSIDSLKFKIQDFTEIRSRKKSH